MKITSIDAKSGFIIEDERTNFRTIIQGEQETVYKFMILIFILTELNKAGISKAGFLLNGLKGLTITFNKETNRSEYYRKQVEANSLDGIKNGKIFMSMVQEIKAAILEGKVQLSLESM